MDEHAGENPALMQFQGETASSEPGLTPQTAAHLPFYKLVSEQSMATTEHDEGDLAAAALFAAADDMFSFAIAALKIALKQERNAGFTEAGVQLEPVAHMVRPALDAFIASHQSVEGVEGITPAQKERSDQLYREHLQHLRERLLDMIHDFEI